MQKLLVAVFLLMGLGLAPMRTTAQAEVKVTVVVYAGWLRNEPSLLGANTSIIKKGEFYVVNARTPDSAWFRTAVSNTWVNEAMVAPFSGDLSALPVLNVNVRPPSNAKLPKLLAGVPPITAAHRALYQRAVASGKDPAFFTIVGDCNSLPPIFLQRIPTGNFNVAGIGGLQRTVAFFSKSFGRISLATNGGLGAAMMLNPTWADEALCDPRTTGEGPFQCELRISRASIVFIALGTQEQYDWQNFEKNYRPMIEHALNKNVLPVLVTKADDIETASGASTGYINDVVRKLAAEYQVPLLDFYAATRDLPNKGLIDEGDKDFHLSYAGMDRRMLTTLQTLALIAGK